MKHRAGNLGLSFVFVALIPFTVAAEAPPSFPPGAEATEARLLAKVGPQTRAWINQEARREAASNNSSEATAVAAVKGNSGLGILNDQDIMAVAFIVMMEAAKSAREDLKTIMDRVKHINDAKKVQRQNLQNGQPQKQSSRQVQAPRPEPVQARNASTVNRAAIQPRPLPKAEFDAQLDRSKNDLDSLSEMGEMESLRLQMAMDRLSKMMSALSNLLKKASETSSSITRNLK